MTATAGTSSTIRATPLPSNGCVGCGTRGLPCRPLEDLPRERLQHSPVIDLERVARAVEFTRFPTSPENDSTPENWRRLVQAADLIGQLGDPLYLKKANALFHEFEEIGLNKQLGYTSPADLVECYPDFYRKRISPHLKEAVAHLNVTAAGRQWIANLHSHVFCAEHSLALMGPERQYRWAGRINRPMFGSAHAASVTGARLPFRPTGGGSCLRSPTCVA